MIQRGGQVVLKIPENIQQKAIEPVITMTIARGALIHTDEYRMRLQDTCEEKRARAELAGVLEQIGSLAVRSDQPLSPRRRISTSSNPGLIRSGSRATSAKPWRS